MKHDSLVRDLHPQHAKKQNRNCVYRNATPAETHKALLKTFYTDVKGFLNATQVADKAEKLADLHEVVEHLMDYYGLPHEEIRMIKEKKRQEFWSFDNKIILEEEIMIVER